MWTHIEGRVDNCEWIAAPWRLASAARTLQCQPVSLKPNDDKHIEPDSSCDGLDDELEPRVRVRSDEASDDEDGHHHVHYCAEQLQKQHRSGLYRQPTRQYRNLSKQFVRQQHDDHDVHGAAQDARLKAWRRAGERQAPQRLSVRPP